MRHIIVGLAIALIAPATFAQTASSQNSQATTRNVPAEVQQFYRDYTAALLGHDIKRIMPFFSERYLHEGRNKAAQRTWILEWLNDLSRLEINITRFTPIDGQRAYVEGLGDDNFNGFVIHPDMQIIKEDGQWKLFGNQKRYDR